MLQVGWQVEDSLLCTHFASVKGRQKAQLLLSAKIVDLAYQMHVVGATYYP